LLQASVSGANMVDTIRERAEAARQATG
jgi:hypothetical protein